MIKIINLENGNGSQNGLLYRIGFSRHHPYTEGPATMIPWCRQNLQMNVEIVWIDANGFWYDEWRFGCEEDRILFRLMFPAGESLDETDD